jgi:arsenate reductase
MNPEARLYGIDTCDQVRKARAWLKAQGVAAPFHDFRRDGISATLLARWLSHLPWDALLNRRSTAWRQLDPDTRATVVDQASALEALLAHPTLIKRPVLECGQRLVLGFSAPHYHELFCSGSTAATSTPERSS